jgi:rubrerythrin
VRIEPGSLGDATGGLDGVPVFLSAGSRAFGEFRCAECGYGVVVRQALPECPMCRGRSWEDTTTSPYADSPA